MQHPPGTEVKFDLVPIPGGEFVMGSPDDEEGRDRVHRPGVLFAAGLITGEALMGIAIAVPIVVSGSCFAPLP